MPTKNDVTGDSIVSKASSKEFRDNFDNIQFGVLHGLHENKHNVEDRQSIKNGSSVSPEDYETLDSENGC